METYNTDFHEITGYKIDASLDNIQEALPEELVTFLKVFSQKKPNRQAQEISSLLKYTKAYPTYLEVYKPLYLHYVKYKKHKECVELLSQMKQQFHDNIWLLAEEIRLNIASKNYQEAQKLLGEDFSLKKLYPHIAVFSELDYMTYYLSVINYHIAQEDPSKARLVLHYMFVLNPEHHLVLEGAHLILTYDHNVPFAQKILHFIAPPDIKCVVAKNTTTIPPLKEEATYHHQREMALLKEYDSENIPKDVIEQILALPHETLKEDLENLFLYATYRVEDEDEDEEEDEDEDDFNTYFDVQHYHALILLTWIGSKDSLPIILDTLRNKDEVLGELYESLLDVIQDAIYILGESQLPVLVAFAKLRYVSSYSKELIYKTLAQVGLHQPERREEVITHLLDLAEEFLQNQHDEGLTDGICHSLIFSAFADLKAKQALPTLRQMYDAGLYDITYMGNWESILLHFEGKIPNKNVNMYPENVFEHYDRSYKQKKCTMYSDAMDIDEFIISLSMGKLLGNTHLKKTNELFFKKLGA